MCSVPSLLNAPALCPRSLTSAVASVASLRHHTIPLPARVNSSPILLPPMLLCSDGGTASRLQHVMAAIDRFSPFNHLVGKSASPAGQPQLSQASPAQQPPSTRTPPSKPQRRPSSDSLRNVGKEDGWPDADRITELLNSMEDARFLLLLLERDSDNLEICSVVSNHMPKEKRPTSIVRMVSSGSEEVGGQALFPTLRLLWSRLPSCAIAFLFEPIPYRDNLSSGEEISSTEAATGLCDVFPDATPSRADQSGAHAYAAGLSCM